MEYSVPGCTVSSEIKSLTSFGRQGDVCITVVMKTASVQSFRASCECSLWLWYGRSVFRRPEHRHHRVESALGRASEQRSFMLAIGTDWGPKPKNSPNIREGYLWQDGYTDAGRRDHRFEASERKIQSKSCARHLLSPGVNSRFEGRRCHDEGCAATHHRPVCLRGAVTLGKRHHNNGCERSHCWASVWCESTNMSICTRCTKCSETLDPGGAFQVAQPTITVVLSLWRIH